MSLIVTIIPILFYFYLNEMQIVSNGTAISDKIITIINSIPISPFILIIIFLLLSFMYNRLQIVSLGITWIIIVIFVKVFYDMDDLKDFTELIYININHTIHVDAKLEYFVRYVNDKIARSHEHFNDKVYIVNQIQEMINRMDKVNDLKDCTKEDLTLLADKILEDIRYELYMKRTLTILGIIGLYTIGYIIISYTEGII